VQVVRTLDRMFAEATDGEKGVLEAYLRAIHFARRFIYIENQYFNNDAITEALIAALKTQPQLKVILLLNPAPDMPLYLGWQQKAVRRIAASLGDAATAAQRFGVFSTWTHASSNSTGGSKPTLVDNYLHTKSALIDNCWATVGSANLDGASLDFLQYARAMLDGEVRNSEANVVVFEETPPPKSAVDGLRRRLWAEHLGFEKADGSANMAASELDDAPGKDWLAVWRQRAAAKRDGLMQNLDAVSPIRILEFPTASFEESLGRCRVLKMHHSHATAVAFLRSLLSPDEQPSDVLVSQLNVLGEKGPPAFEFEY
jgi:phosphatidylserine/phosphatidylglycerophosphate/cardiolipin synthase-like enzyme